MSRRRTAVAVIRRTENSRHKLEVALAKRREEESRRSLVEPSSRLPIVVFPESAEQAKEVLEYLKLQHEAYESFKDPRTLYNSLNERRDGEPSAAVRAHGLAVQEGPIRCQHCSRC